MKSKQVIPKVPRTSLIKLRTEILSKGPDAALPGNLSDPWLRMIARDLARSHKAIHIGVKADSHLNLKAPLLLVLALLTKTGATKDAETIYSAEDLLSYMQCYERAIYEELIGRETGVFINRWSIDNIFNFVGL